MPGLSTRVLKPNVASADQKRKNSNRKQQRVLKRIRVIYSDPDATDSSSDDEQGTRQDSQQYTCHGAKRRVKVIRMFESILHAEKNSKVSSQNVLNSKGMRSTSKYVGVRQRKSGRWVAEIREPLHNVRQWLGTHNTEEEAYLAYEKKRLEFQALLIEQKRVKALIATRRSPSSVLEVSNTTSHGSDTNVNRDCNQREAKEVKFDIEDEMKPEQILGLFSNSEFDQGDLKIVFDELKEEDFLMCNLGDLADLPNSSALLDLDMEDFSWLDEVFKYCGFED